MDAIWAVLPFLAFLACPLMMVFCLFGMRKMGCAAPPPTETQAPSPLPAERVAVLQQQLEAIQAELTTLQPALAPTSASAPVSGDEHLVEVISGTAHATRRLA